MALRSLLAMFSHDLAVDLGTANTLVYAGKEGVVINEPSIVAINNISGDVEAIGTVAKRMLGRTPGSITAIRPMKDGVIADFKIAERMLTYFINKAHDGRRILVYPRIIIGVPSQITLVERRAVVDTAMRANASEVHLVEQAMMAAIGAGLPVKEPAGSMVVDIGGGTTDIAVISLSGIVTSRSVSVAGNTLDQSIMHYLKREYNFMIGEHTAEAIKIKIGSASEIEDSLEMQVKGRNLARGVPGALKICDDEIRRAISDDVDRIMIAIREALENTPPELSGDICERGIVLTGGGAYLRNLDQRIREETGVPVSVAESPLECVVIGTGKILGDIDLLRRISLV